MRDEYAGLADVYDRMARDPGIRVFYREWRQALLAAASGRTRMLSSEPCCATRECAC
jgi:hypothetical protein